MIIYDFRVQAGENLLTTPLRIRQSILTTLDKMCSCLSDENQCTFETFTSCLTVKEKPMQCIDTLDRIQPSRKKRDTFKQSIVLASESRTQKSLVSTTNRIYPLSIKY